MRLVSRMSSRSNGLVPMSANGRMIQQIAKITMKAPKIKYKIPNVSAMKSPPNQGESNRNAHYSTAKGTSMIAVRWLIAAMEQAFGNLKGLLLNK